MYYTTETRVKLENKMNITYLDHITITAPTLEAGARLVCKSLGVNPQKGGEHPKMGTHNLFLRLGDAMFLEVIAINPEAIAPERPRWFALDEINAETPAKLMTWVVRTNNIQKTITLCPDSIGEVVSMSRGNTNWLISIPKDGSLPEQGAAPGLIQWQVEKHPAESLINHGLTLEKLRIIHPKPQEIKALIKKINLDAKIEVLRGTETKLVATIRTPTGLKTLSA